MSQDKNSKVNATVALCCGTILHSKHRHDFVTCKCGQLSIDGGNDYIKIVGDKTKYYYRIQTLIELEALQEVQKNAK